MNGYLAMGTGRAESAASESRRERRASGAAEACQSDVRHSMTLVVGSGSGIEIPVSGVLSYE